MVGVQADSNPHMPNIFCQAVAYVLSVDKLSHRERSCCIPVINKNRQSSCESMQSAQYLYC